MTAYLEGKHHPQEALLPRVGYVAEVDGAVIGYIAGHQTRRFGYEGEVQYLFVAPPFRRQGVASALLGRLARWFEQRGTRRVCVDVDVDGPEATAFYVAHGATPINRCWYGWEDLGGALGTTTPRAT